MRARYIVVAVLFLLGFGVKPFTVMAVEAASRAKGGVTFDISQMHWDANNLPVEEFHDMSLVFPVFPAVTDLKESSSPDFLATIASKER
jgi:hypothetical protein